MSNTEANPFSETTPEIEELARICRENDVIDPSLYLRYNVKRGLRDVNGKGVLTGLTEIAEVKSYTIDDDEMVPCPGKLYYRGYNIEDLVKGFSKERRFGFEETTYLLMFGKLPTQDELKRFNETIDTYRQLPTNFVRDIIMKAPSNNMMNSMARSVLTYYSYDPKAEQTDLENVLRQCIQLIAMFPQLAVYSYQAYAYYLSDSTSFFFHDADPSLSTAENILYMLRQDGCYTRTEALALDTALIVHAEHGGGNNSTFTTHVVSSSGTDTYATISAALGSLKGPKHGGANIKVTHMMEEIKHTVKDWSDEGEITSCVQRILDKNAFDRTGLIYGIGHAIYSQSDPRAEIFRRFVQSLAKEKNLEQEYYLYAAIERIAPELISGQRKMYKGVSANVDFYSGFVYSMLEIPLELYTPIFAIARIVGWSAHRIEELLNMDKIIRPAYKSVMEERAYVPMEER